MRIRRYATTALVALMGAMGLQLIAALPASAAGTLTGVSFNMSKPLPGDTSVRYTWLFTTATTGTVATATFTVPTGTAGASLTVTDIAGLPSGGTATLSGTTVTYTPTATSVASGTKCLIAIDGFTNGSVTASFQSAVTTNTSVPAAIDGPTNSTAISINDNATPATVIIARSSSFGTSANSESVLLDPSVNTNVSAPALTLTIKSNAASGYTLNVKATSLSDTGAPVNTIPPLTSGVATATSTFTSDHWGYIATKTGVGVLQGAVSGTNYAGYTAAGENLMVAAGPTATDTVTITNRVQIDYAQDANTYSSTVTYTMGETY
jgi:large repetitive protein